MASGAQNPVTGSWQMIVCLAGDPAGTDDGLMRWISTKPV